MDQPIEAGLMLRLCECKPGEVVEGALIRSPPPTALGSPPPLLIGNAVEAKWDPTHPNRIIVLYTSGTLRLWDVLTDARRDFALYIPAGEMPQTGSIPDRRLAMRMTHFEFLPFVGDPYQGAEAATRPSKSGLLPRIAFTIRGNRRLFMCDIPQQQPEALSLMQGGQDSLFDGHYLSGSRVYEAQGLLPGEASCMCGWLLTGRPTPVASLVVGTDDGSISGWVMSAAFNPETLVSMRSLRHASPGFVRVETEGSISVAAEEPIHFSTLAHPLNSALSGQKTTRKGVRAVTPLTTIPWDIIVDDDAGKQVTTVLTGPHKFAKDLHSKPCNNMFISAGDDGRVQIWRINISAPLDPLVPDPTSFLLRRGPHQPAFAISVSNYASIPNAVVVSAIGSYPWPVPTGSNLATVLSATRVLYERPIFAHGKQLPPHLRTLAVVGNVEGTVTIWELLIPYRDSFIVDGGVQLTTAGRSLNSEPSVRLVATNEAHSLEPVFQVALTVGPGDGAFILAVASGDGGLQTFKLDGTGAGGEEYSPSMGTFGPLQLRQLADLGDASAPNASPHGVEAIVLEQLEQVRRSAADETISVSTPSIQSPPPRYNAYLTTAMTAAAVVNLRRAMVSCAFNESSALSFMGSSEGMDSPAHRALMACTGAGEILLWARQMVVTPKPSRRGSAGGEQPLTAPDGFLSLEETGEVNEKDSPEVLQSKFDSPRRHQEGAGSEEATDSASRKALSSAAEIEAPSTLPADAAAQEVHNMNTAPTQDPEEHEATVEIFGPQDLSPNPSVGSVPNVLRDTMASIARRRSGSPVDAHRHQRLPSQALDTQSRLFFRQAAADALRGTYEHMGTRTPERINYRRLDVAQHLTPNMARLSPLDRWVSRIRPTVARKYGVGEKDLAEEATAPEGMESVTPRGRSASRERQGVPRSRSASKDASERADRSANYSNPAKVAAVLVRDVRETSRVSRLLADGTSQFRPDDHIDAVSLYSRIADRGPEEHHHLVAPGVGASNAVEEAIRELESLNFDTAAALAAVLQERRITDRKVHQGASSALGLLFEEVLAQDGQVEDATDENRTEAEDELAYVPRASMTASGIASAQTHPQQQPNGLATVQPRLLQPTQASLMRSSAMKSDSVSASDLLKWHAGLRTQPS